MAKKVMTLLLVPALAAPSCLKQGTLGKDPFLPAPSMYVADWASCAKNCEQSLLCKEFSFKEDTVPTTGGCWMFNKVDVDFQEDSKAVTGDKTCQDPVTAETPATIEAAKDNVAAISSATATSLGGVANTVAGAASTGVASLSDQASSAMDDASSAVHESQGKDLMATETGSSDNTGPFCVVVGCVLGGIASAVSIAWERYCTMNRGTRSAETEENLVEEAPTPTGADLELQAPPGYAGYQYSQGQYMAYQPGAAYQQPMQPQAMEPTTYMPRTTPA